MGRFEGWTMADVERLKIKHIDFQSKIKKRKPKANKDYVSKISVALDTLGVDHVLEYKFLKDRRFRFDLAIPEHKIAVEFDGGIYSKGRHTRGKGYANDAKKYNLATMHGWRLLRYTTDDVNILNWEFRAADEIKQLIEDFEYLK